MNAGVRSGASPGTAGGALRRQRGISYAEVLIAVALVAGALAPALQVVSSALPGAGIHADMAQGMSPVFGKMEELLARPYPVLQRAAASGGSAGGSAGVAIAAYDPTAVLAFPLPAAAPPGPGYTDTDFDVYINAVDPATGADSAVDTGLLRLRVQAKAAGGGSLTAFKARTEAWE